MSCSHAASAATETEEDGAEANDLGGALHPKVDAEEEEEEGEEVGAVTGIDIVL